MQYTVKMPPIIIKQVVIINLLFFGLFHPIHYRAKKLLFYFQLVRKLQIRFLSQLRDDYLSTF